MWTQALAIGFIAAVRGFLPWALGAILLGAGTAMMYPTLLAAIGDVAHPAWRASAVGVYRLWRDGGFAIGALLAGLVADLLGMAAAIWVVAALTAASGLVVALRMYETHRQRKPALDLAIAQPNAFEWIATGDLVGDRVLSHCREHAQDVPRASDGAPLLAQHVVNELVGVLPAQIGQWPIPQHRSVNLDIKHAAHPMVVGRISALGARVALGPVRGIRAHLVPCDRRRRGGRVVGRVDRGLGLALVLEGAGAAPFAARARLARDPDDLA